MTEVGGGARVGIAHGNYGLVGSGYRMVVAVLGGGDGIVVDGVLSDLDLAVRGGMMIWRANCAPGLSVSKGKWTSPAGR